MKPDAGEDRLQSARERGGEKVAVGAKLAEGVDDERAAGTQDAPDGGEGFAGEKVRRRGIAQKGIKNDRIVMFAAAIEEMAAIVNGELNFFGLEIEGANGDRDNGRVDFDDI